MATIKEVAALAGVSVATVSRYMNQKGYVSQVTSLKIQDAITELNYVPNEVARSLFQKSSKLIGVIFPDIANPYFPLVAKGIEEELNQNGFMMILANTSDQEETFRRYVTTFSQNNVSGIITAIPFPPALDCQMKVVGIDRVYEGDFPKVLADDYGGGQQIAQQILATSFENILILPGNLTITSSAERFKGLTGILKEHAIDYHVIELNSYNNDNIPQVIEEILPLFSKYDTIVAANDYLAINLLKQAKQLNLRVPEDIQIIGYDGIAFTELIEPALSTVEQPAYAIGQEAAKQMIYYLNHPDKEQFDPIIMPIKFKEGATLRK